MELYGQGMLPSHGLPYQSNTVNIVDIMFEQREPWKQRVATEVFSLSRTHAENRIVYSVLPDKSFSIWEKDKVWKAKNEGQTDKKKESN